MRMYRTYNGERGQAIVLLVVTMIVLLGFAGLAIDGGNLYAQRRHAQATVDNAALAYGLSLSRNETQSTAEERARTVLQLNGYVDGEGAVQIDFQPNGNEITVTLHNEVPTAFIHLVYGGPAAYTVSATALGRPATVPFSGYGIVALNRCSGNNHVIDSNGGGNSGGINVYNSGMLVNLPNPPSSNCAFDPPNSSGSYGITATDGLCNPGTATDYGTGNMDPVTPNCPDGGGQVLQDPMGPLNSNPPQCTSDGGQVGGVWQPGNYDESPGGPPDPPGWGVYAPGIYCIEGQIDPSGNGTIVGNGVLLYFMLGSCTGSGSSCIDLSGQGYMSISAPNKDNCGAEQPAGLPLDRTLACNYKGLVIYSAPGNQGSFEVGGNGGSNFTGTIYIPEGTFDASGGGSNPQDTVVTGQIIAGAVINNGNGSLRLVYDESKIFKIPPEMQLLK